MKNLIIILIASLFSLQLSLAQDYREKVDVALSNPGQIGTLKLHIQSGNIRVVGHTQNNVTVTFENTTGSKKDNRGTLKRIPNTAMNIDIVESNNVVSISGNNNRTDYIVNVPSRFNLSLSSHHNADIFVEDVSGEIEVQSHHGGIELKEVGGSVIAETHHGSIYTSMTSIDQSRPMAFTTHHGEIEVVFPSSLSCSTKMKSAKGDIYTDFEMNIKPVPREKSINSKGENEIRVGGWINGDIGGGGKEYMFTTYHGDIILRKN